MTKFLSTMVLWLALVLPAAVSADITTGIKRANVDQQGTVTFVHAGSSGVRVDEEKLKMNIDRPDDLAVNAFLRGRPKNGCPTDGDSVPRLSGQLFIGYGTIRNPAQQ